MLTKHGSAVAGQLCYVEWWWVVGHEEDVSQGRKARMNNCGSNCLGSRPEIASVTATLICSCSEVINSLSLDCTTRMMKSWSSLDRTGPVRWGGGPEKREETFGGWFVTLRVTAGLASGRAGGLEVGCVLSFGHWREHAAWAPPQLAHLSSTAVHSLCVCSPAHLRHAWALGQWKAEWPTPWHLKHWRTLRSGSVR